MKDSLKFRFWDKQINKMRYGDIQIDCNGMPFIISPELPKLVQDIDDVITLQSIGLRDKNNKLIFEGDIIEETYYSKDLEKYQTCRYVVKKDDKFCAYGLWDEQLKSFACYFLDIDFKSEDFEIIGNIYENLELLTGEKHGV